MAKGPIELAPRGVRPLKSGDLEKRELFEEIGRAIVHLSDIESWLIAIAYHVSSPLAGMKVPEMFYAIVGFEKRLQFADVVVEIEARKDEKARWRAIVSELKHHRQIRNFIAHNAMGTSLIPDKEGRYDVFLHSPELKNIFGQRRFVRIKEIRATASALSKISKDLEKLWNDIDDTWLPKEFREDELPDE